MSQSGSPEMLQVLYDGECPLCRREIAHVKGLAQRRGDSGLCFVDISGAVHDDSLQGVRTHGAKISGDSNFAADRATLLARFHVQRADGSRLDGARAFVAMWQRLPGWRWLARLSRLPGALVLLELAYRGFLRVRPALQALARRLDSTGPSRLRRPGRAAESAPGATQAPALSDCATQAPALSDRATQAPALSDRAAPSPALSGFLERELRSDHAGEMGAVFIYRGIAAVATRRGNAELLAFAQGHGATEAEHLRLIEAWLPPARRSRLLGPWRLAGWLTGALPALLGARAVYATIAAVETFVDRHYQQQIDHLQRHGGPQGLLALLLRCQADERHHRDEAAALAGSPAPRLLRLWCALVGAGSAAAVVLARRV